MNRLAAATSWLIVGTGLLLAFAYPSEASEKELQGTWTATKAEQDGKSDSAVVGHRLSFAGNRFQIQSKDLKSLYSGTVQVDASAKPAAIDFEHTDGELERERVERDIRLRRRHADNLRKRTKPGERAARCVRGEGRVRACSHHAQTREALNDAATSVRRAPRAGVAALFAESDAEGSRFSLPRAIVRETSATRQGGIRPPAKR